MADIKWSAFTSGGAMTTAATAVGFAGGVNYKYSLSSTPSASGVACWNANSNLSANNFLSGYATTVTAAATTTLTVASPYRQYFTGATTQTVLMPVTSTLVLGQAYMIVNMSSGAVTVESSGGNVIQVMASGTTLWINCILTSGTTAASWSVEYFGASGGGVNPGIINDLAYYAATGSSVSALATGNNGLLVTSAIGAPSIGNAILADITVHGITVGRGLAGSATNTAIGASALAASNTNTNVVAVGTNALAASTGSNAGIVAIGYNALSAATAPGAANVVVGDGAVTSASFTGTGNVIIGHISGAALTSGSDNVVVGDDALHACTTGSSNIAIGALSLLSVSTSGDNIAVGHLALQNNTASQNIAIGSNALNALTTISANIAIGYQAAQLMVGPGHLVAMGPNVLAAATNGNNITAVGYNALTLATTPGNNSTVFGAFAMSGSASQAGNDNTAIGFQALSASTSGAQNTALGSGALVASTSGQGSTAIGFQALTTSTTASFNTAVGYFAATLAASATDLVVMGASALAAATSGNDLTVIGYNALLLATAPGNNTTAIGSKAISGSASYVGTDNTAIGYQALKNCTTGIDHVAIGSGAMQATTSGTGSVAIGYQAMTGITTNGNSVAIGYQALRSASMSGQNVAIGGSAISSASYSGSNSTGVGHNSMFAVTSGIQNTCLGALTANNTPSGSANLTTGSQNTLIGYAASVNNLAATGTIALGSSAVGIIASGATSGDNGPGITFGSTTSPVGFRGDGTIYSGGTGRGYWRPNLNGTAYLLPCFIDGTLTANATMTTDSNGSPILTAGIASGTVNSGTANQLAYYATTGTAVSGLTISNQAILTTDGSGAPAWASLLAGEILIGTTAGAPAAATITPGPGISVANGSGSITISATGGGIGWTPAASTPVTAAINTGYIVTDASQVTFTLPVTAAVGSVVRIAGNGAGGWILAPGAGQTIKVLVASASTSITSAEQYDCIEVVCTVANTTWVAISMVTTGFTIS